MAVEIDGYKIRDQIHSGKKWSVYRALCSTDGPKLTAKIPNAEYPSVSSSVQRGSSSRTETT